MREVLSSRLVRCHGSCTLSFLGIAIDAPSNLRIPIAHTYSYVLANSDDEKSYNLAYIDRQTTKVEK